MYSARIGFKCRKAAKSGENFQKGGVLLMYAIIETGGKQYKVKEGDIITVEKLNVDAGTAYTFDQVLSVADGEAVSFGAPYISGASVSASVVGDGKGKKIVVYKFKAKKNYHRKKGHRQPFTRLKIDSITAG